MQPADYRLLSADLIAGRHIDGGRWQDFFTALFDQDADSCRLAALLALLARAGREQPDIYRTVLVACGRCLQTLMKPVRSSGELLDIVGTGGDGKKTLNISTAAAIVVAATGIPVAKHGNRAMTSQSGAADVLTAAGVDINLTVTQIEKQLAAAGLAFLFAPAHHPALAKVAAVRKSLDFPTFFNILGPLMNPALPAFSLIGCYRSDLAAVMIESLFALNSACQRAWVVHSCFGFDELFPAGDNLIWIGSRSGAQRPRFETCTLSASDCAAAGLATQISHGHITGGTPAYNAQCLLSLLAGSQRDTAFHDVVVLNAAAAIRVVTPELSLADAAARARTAISDGRAQAKLSALRNSRS